jgi:nicotinamidase-related amidase
MGENVGISHIPESNTATALLVLDMINAFDFDDGEPLFRNTVPAAKRIRDLCHRAAASDIPVIYVNDNFGKWQENFKDQINIVGRESLMGREIIEYIRPRDENYYVLKPHRSGFYETPLSLLLSSMKTRRLILTGVTTDICVLFTANDAYMRGYEVAVPEDCTAAVTADHKAEALDLLVRVAYADVTRSDEIELAIQPTQ